MSESSWISIPGTYAENSDMWMSVLPLLIISLVPTFVANLAYAVGADTGTVDLVSLATSDSHSQSSISIFYEMLFEPFENALDIASAFILVRMAKLIGADRDIIIADKIDEACRLYPTESEFVVVIGMLHCNGVARRLLTSK